MAKRYTILQLSDLHLTGEPAIDASYRRFVTVLNQALVATPDLLLITGDLVNNGVRAGYDWLFARLQHIGIPYLCTAGNHDVSVEHNTHLPFAKRYLTPIPPDFRLQPMQVHRLGDWQIIVLDSSCSGAIAGHLSAQTLEALGAQLSQCQQPTLLALHHHPLAVGSAWIDAHRLQNAEAFLQRIASCPHVQAVICGHVHQAHTLSYRHIALYTCPAVARQFLPYAKDFTEDTAPSGWRLIHLTGNHLNTTVQRLIAPL